MLYIDGKLASLDQKNYANFHGNSVFTTLRSKARELLYWDLHWRRLSEHADYFGYTMPKESEVLDLLRKNIEADKKLRVIVSQNNYAITCEPYSAPSDEIYLGVKVIYSDITIHPVLGRFKTGNSLPYFLAQRQAQRAGAFEGLLLDCDGFVVDGSRTSLMMVKDQTIYSLMGGLDGVMRQAVIMWAKSVGIKCEEVKVKPHEISGSLLLANSLMGVVPVDSVSCEISRALVQEFR